MESENLTQRIHGFISRLGELTPLWFPAGFIKKVSKMAVVSAAGLLMRFCSPLQAHGRGSQMSAAPVSAGNGWIGVTQSSLSLSYANNGSRRPCTCQKPFLTCS